MREEKSMLGEFRGQMPNLTEQLEKKQLENELVLWGCSEVNRGCNDCGYTQSHVVNHW